MLEDEDPESKHYFKSNFLIRVFRFFNLMEPDRNIISISKMFSWFMMFLICMVLMYYPENLEAILVVVAGFMATLLNYSYRRYMQYLTVKTTGKPANDADLEEIPVNTVTTTTVSSVNVPKVDSPDDSVEVDPSTVEDQINTPVDPPGNNDPNDPANQIDPNANLAN